MTITVDRFVAALRRCGRTELADTVEFEAQAFDEVRVHPVAHDHDQNWPAVGRFDD